MLTDWTTDLPLVKEQKITIAQFRELLIAGRAQGDLAALCVAAMGRHKHRPCHARELQSEFMTACQLSFDQYERLNHLALWPSRFQNHFRLALQKNNYQFTVAVLDARIEFFISTNGNDYEEKTNKQKRATSRD